MKVTFIGHASILIETHGLAILSDPWWDHPCFGAQWWNYPRATGSLAENRRIDYVYISHGHHDHLHLGTLGKIDRNAKVLIAAGTDMREPIEGAGFEVIEIGPDDEYSLADVVNCRIMPTYADDTLMVLSDGREVCVNLNDALHSAPADVQKRFVTLLRKRYPAIDYVFCGYGVASHFPNCYRIPGKNPEATADARQRHFTAQWVDLIARLEPRFAFPFAADVVLLQNDLFWTNEPTHNSERPPVALKRLHPEFAGTALDIAPGFVVEDGAIVQAQLREPLRAEFLREKMSAEITKANRFGSANQETVVGLSRLIAENLDKCRGYLASHPSDYRMLVRFMGTQEGIAIEKNGSTVHSKLVDEPASTEWDVTFTTRAQYLRSSLTRKYGFETIFVGSGGIFDYLTREHAERNLHRELAVVMRPHDQPLSPRRPPPPPLIGAVKRMIKSALGRYERDLYDLGSWTVWN